MGDARRILDERLAKGEISQQEHADLIDRIAEPSPPNTASAAAPAAAPEKKTESKIWQGLQAIGGVAIAIFVLAYIFGGGARNLTVSNIESTGSSVVFDILNGGTREGDILVWVEQNDIRKCDAVFRMRPNGRITNLSIPCRPNPGQFTLNYAWASTDDGRAALARRINVNW